MAGLAASLDASSLISVPLRSRDRTLGRVYVASRRRRYGRRDLRSLAQLVAHAGPSIENMKLVEQLALTIASQERSRISRDLHDGTVQPYIGLKLALEALRRRLGDDGPFVREVEELTRMAADGISELRNYVGRLRESERSSKAEQLVQAVRCQASKFSEFCGIPTEVLADDDICVPSRLHDEVIQMVREALSNVRRHTRATRAAVALRASAGRLVLEVSNDTRGEEAPPFRPHSIAERVAELGGRLDIFRAANGDTVVRIDVPR